MKYSIVICFAISILFKPRGAFRAISKIYDGAFVKVKENGNQ